MSREGSAYPARKVTAFTGPQSTELMSIRYGVRMDPPLAFDALGTGEHNRHDTAAHNAVSDQWESACRRADCDPAQAWYRSTSETEALDSAAGSDLTRCLPSAPDLLSSGVAGIAEAEADADAEAPPEKSGLPNGRMIRVESKQYSAAQRF
jgi:hypothetical protein